MRLLSQAGKRRLFFRYPEDLTTMSHLKKLDSGFRNRRKGGAEFQPAGVLKIVGELKRGTSTEIGTKDFFEIDSIKVLH